MAVEKKDVKNKARVTDSEGLKVVTAGEVEEDQPKKGKSAAQKAYEAEVAAIAEEEAKKQEEFEKFLAGR